MAVKITCPCGSENLAEIPSGENSEAYECRECGTTILVQYIRPEKEDEESNKT